MIATVRTKTATVATAVVRSGRLQRFQSAMTSRSTEAFKDGFERGERAGFPEKRATRDASAVKGLPPMRSVPREAISYHGSAGSHLLFPAKDLTGHAAENSCR